MNRYNVNYHKSYGPIQTIVVEASSWESAGRKAERNDRVVTSVSNVECQNYCEGECACE